MLDAPRAEVAAWSRSSRSSWPRASASGMCDLRAPGGRGRRSRRRSRRRESAPTARASRAAPRRAAGSRSGSGGTHPSARPRRCAGDVAASPEPARPDQVAPSSTAALTNERDRRAPTSTTSASSADRRSASRRCARKTRRAPTPANDDPGENERHAPQSSGTTSSRPTLRPPTAPLNALEALRHRLPLVFDPVAETREPLRPAVEHGVDDACDVVLPRASAPAASPAESSRSETCSVRSPAQIFRSVVVGSAL